MHLVYSNVQVRVIILQYNECKPLDSQSAVLSCFLSVKLNEHYVNTTDFLDAIKTNLDKALGK